MHMKGRTFAAVSWFRDPARVLGCRIRGAGADL